MLLSFEEFKEKVFDIAKKYGFDDYELYYEEATAFSLSTYEMEIDEYVNTKLNGVNFRGVYKGNAGSSFSEILDEESAEFLVKTAFDIANILETEDKTFFHDGSGEYKNVKLYSDSINKISIEDKINFVLEMEREAYLNEKIDKVQETGFGNVEGIVKIVNSKGLNLESKINGAYNYISLSAKDKEGYNYISYESETGNSISELKEKNIVKKAVDNVIAKIGQKPIESGKYKCIFHKDAFNSIFSVFISNLNAEICQKGFSKLANQIGKSIASENITIIDNPHIDYGSYSAIFDGEGYPTKIKTVVENGILKMYFHNMTTAYNDNIETTGNAMRAGFKSLVGISGFNVYIENGNISYKEMIKEMGKGIIIDEFSGLHAGMNSLSGDFSLSCSGFYVENGEIQFPMHQIIISDNVFSIMKRIDKLANDREIDDSTPSVMVLGEVSISGE